MECKDIAISRTTSNDFEIYLMCYGVMLLLIIIYIYICQLYYKSSLHFNEIST